MERPFARRDEGAHEDRPPPDPPHALDYEVFRRFAWDLKSEQVVDDKAADFPWVVMTHFQGVLKDKFLCTYKELNDDFLRGWIEAALGDAAAAKPLSAQKVAEWHTPRPAKPFG